jgi:cyclopropane fatty-acyl-phospholipid synthase-like methyltransferase
MQAEKPARATLVDLSNDAFDYGRQLAAEKDVADQVTFIQGDVREVHEQLDDRVDIVKMIGICEYLSDEQIVAIARALQRLCPPGSSVVFNSISPKHGTDRFFRRVFGLHMNHRTPAQLQDLLRQGGYGDFEVFPEPLGVYHVMVGRMQQTGQDHAAH